MIIYIEGSIGVGKSTLLRILKTKYNNDYIEYIQEPVEEWKQITDDQNINILDHFYNLPHRWSFTFQLNTLLSRINKLKNLDPNKIYIIERSVYSDKNCFAQNCYTNNLMNKIEWNTYIHIFDMLTKNIDIKPDGFIYLKSSPDICLKRIINRNRNEENGIKKKYLEQINNLHNEWLNNTNIKTLIINFNIGYLESPITFSHNVTKIIKFIDDIYKRKNKEIFLST